MYLEYFSRRRRDDELFEHELFEHELFGMMSDDDDMLSFDVDSIEWPFDERRSGSGAIYYDDDII